MAQTIRPQAFDRFSSSTYRRSPAHSEWDPAVLKVLVDRLVGHRVVVEVDAFTGHAVEAVVVGWKNQTAHSDYPHVTLKSVHGDLTNYRVSKIGVLMDLDNSDARWDADRELGERGDRALAAVRTFLGATWVVIEDEPLNWRSTHHLDGSVSVQAVYPRGEHAGIPTATWTVSPGGSVRQGAMATRDLERGRLTLR